VKKDEREDSVEPTRAARIGDVVRLKKPHPCGTNAWEIIRMGMDVGLGCTGCGRRVRLPRAEFERRFRGFVE
jgi:hypothetical protein